MSKLLSENTKIDIGLTSQNLNGSVTGPYYKMTDYNKALFIVEVSAMAAGKTAVLQVVQAKDAAGDGSKNLTNSTATITANEKVASAKITAATVVAGDKVTINGLTYEAIAAAGDDAGPYEFKLGANDSGTATNLAAAINDTVSGAPGIKATANAAVVTLAAVEPGKATITIKDAAATLTPATVAAIGYVECHISHLDHPNGFCYVALKVTTTAAAQTGAILLRGDGRFSPVQKVAAAKTNVVAAT